MVWIDNKSSWRSFLSKWWLDELYQDQTIQIEILPENLPYIDNHTVVYVKIQDTDVKNHV